MGTQVTLDNDVRNELISRAIELDMVFSSVNEVLRVILNMTKKGANVNSDNYPSSRVHKAQSLLDGLRDTIFSISKNGMKYYSKRRRWVANPNVVTITKQDARANNLRITVYGRPNEFEGIKPSLEIKEDMSGYSRFLLNSESQLPSAIKVIQHSYKFKKDRGRLFV